MTPTPPASPRMLSVIVPVYNSTETLRQCLAALSESSLRDFEVVVVDDGSSEPVALVAAEHEFRCLRIEGPGGPRGPARARNCGVAATSSKYVVFIDADVCVHTDTLTHISNAFARDPGIAAVVGCYDDSPAEPNFLSQYKNLFHHYVHLSSAGEITTFWSGCGAMRREVFLRFGGFDEDRYRRPAIEDIELGTLVTAAGHRIVLDTAITVKHLKRWTLWSLIRSDIFDRGVPWTRLMLRTRSVPGALNPKSSQRAAIVFVYLAAGAVGTAVVYPLAWIAAATFAVFVMALNLDFYRYLGERRGVWFALRAVPLHWLYFGYCGISVVLGTLAHYLSERGGSTTLPARKADT